ncbi:MAG: adenosylcobinamide-phosphate synthase CbiB [Bacillota bacterium]|nr:adenosylcobinamide-phosphate synthase CbiB [Bacillota bacterium]
MDRPLLFALAFCAAYFLDLILGDPQGWPHPVRQLGKIIIFLERAARKTCRSPAALKAAGAVILIIAAGGSAMAVFLALRAAYSFHVAAGLILEIYLFYSVLGGGDLRSHITRVERPLGEGSRGKARSAVAMLVSRDTGALDESGIARAALESLFENSSDGLVAPLIFAAFLGPVGAVFYKAVNTLDSMIGYKTEEYAALGFFAAKADDLLNLIPARFTALLIVALGLLQGRAGDSWRVLKKDRYNHDSPNSAWPEAAAAGVLGVSLGGVDVYGGKRIERPIINAWGCPAQYTDLRNGLVLFGRLSIAAFVLTLLAAWWIR